MSKVDGHRASVEHAAAGILNGGMVALLGSILPGVLIWRTLAHPENLEASAALLANGQWRSFVSDSLNDVVLLVFSCVMMWRGLRYALKNLAALRADRR